MILLGTSTPSIFVPLNVNGQRMNVSRAALTLIRGTRLWEMFSGNNEDRLPKDKDGHIILNYNPRVSYFLDLLHAEIFRNIVSNRSSSELNDPIINLTLFLKLFLILTMLTTLSTRIYLRVIMCD